MDEDLINKIEENSKDLPEEVSDFMFFGPLDLVLEKICLLINNEEEKVLIKNDITFFLLGSVEIETLNSHIESLKTTEENRGEIKRIFQEDIISEILLLLEVNQEMEGSSLESLEVNSDQNTQQAPSPAQALESIKERLSQSTKITPTKRDYSMEKAENSNPSVQNITKPTIDPYREIPEKE